MSYREYIERTLDRDALMEKNRNAPDGTKFCNAICFDYLPLTRFTGQQVICNQCRSMISVAEKRIRQNQLTLEQFKKNPMMVYGDGTETIGTKKRCDTCHQDKPVSAFEINRQICKSCRYLQASARNTKALEGYIRDIEQLKTQIPLLENFIQHIPKDCLIMIIAHYGVGRKATDCKTVMVYNIVQHFRSLLHPDKCRRCGSNIIPPLTLCGGCDTKPNPPMRYEKRKTFMDTLDNTIEKLRPLDPEKDMDLYNKDELSLLSKRVGLQFDQMIKKKDLFNMFNTFLIEREVECEKKRAEEELLKKREEVHFELTMGEFMIQARKSDGFINGTQLCKAGGKLFADWYRLEITKTYCEVLAADMGRPISQLIDVKKGNSHKFAQGSWIHPDLATNLALWISPIFGVQVSRWIREIITTGKAEYDSKPNDELIRLQLELQKEQDARKKLEINHKRVLQRREYHKFQKGACFYIIKVDDDKFKIGFDGIDINERFRTYRTSIPLMKICFMVFSPKASLIEECMLLRFQDYLVENNHEFMSNISLLELTASVDTLLKYCKIPYQLVSTEDIITYNEDH